MVLVTDGEETVYPLVSTVLPQIKEKGIIINTISIDRYATDSLELWVSSGGGGGCSCSCSGSSGSSSSSSGSSSSSVIKAGQGYHTITT